MKKGCKITVVSSIMAIVVLWIGAWIPEVLDANIMPRPGQKTVWWGLQWIVTNFIALVALTGLAMHNFEECSQN
jgi:peptidoglycan biosynthesis protein MviN/MurJ (putative lipid II flippase)